MPKLIVKRKAEVIDEFELSDSKSTFTIGSDLDNDFTISDKKVSLKHFRIENVHGAFYLEDLKSAFGTHLNGRPVLDPVQIVDGDEISIGDLNIVFEHIIKKSFQLEFADNEEIDVMDDSDFESTVGVNQPKSSTTKTKQDAYPLEVEASVIQTSGEDFYEIEDTTEGIQIAATEAPDTGKAPNHRPTHSSYHLLAIYGPYLGKKFVLNFGDTKIGRDTKLNDIVLRRNENGELDPSISRRHATISYKNGRFFVTDKRSKTRTWVNQTKLNPSDEVPLDVGDEIEIVSDQKSTIFRLIANDEIDLSPPKKAGIWWIRNNHRVSAALSIVLSIIALWVIGHSFEIRSAITKSPHLLKVVEQSWHQTNGELSNAKGDGAGTESLPAIGNLALADLTGDKKVDLVFSEISGKLVALDGKSKTVIWETNDIGVHNTVPIVLEDLNENGLADVLVVGSDSRLRALDGTNGAEIWLSPILGEPLSGPPTVSDLNGDGLKDIVVSTEAGQIHMGYGGIYNMNWKTIITGLAMRAAPSSCDWDGDGNSEVFVGTEEGKVLIINGSTGKVARVLDVNEGISKATGEVYTTNRIRNPVALADIARNKVIDLLISSTSGNYLAMEGNSLARIWHEQWPHDFDSKAQYLTPSLGDVDGDRIDDVVLVSNRRIKVIKGVGNTKTRKQVLWEFNLDNKDVFVTPATLADVNKDKSNDIIIGSMRGTIHILSGKNGEIITQINNDGNPPVSPLLVADLEDDGYMDVLLIRKDLNIYKIQTNSSIQKSSVIWGQVFSNAQHTSKLDYKSPGTVSYDLYITASGFMLFCVIITNIAARKKRQQLILRNQST